MPSSSSLGMAVPAVPGSGTRLTSPPSSAAGEAVPGTQGERGCSELPLCRAGSTMANSHGRQEPTHLLPQEPACRHLIERVWGTHRVPARMHLSLGRISTETCLEEAGTQAPKTSFHHFPVLETWHPCSFHFCWCMQTNEENDISQTQTSANTYTKLKVSSCQKPTQNSVTHRHTLLSQHTHVGSLQPALTASQTSQPKPMWGLFCVWRNHPHAQALPTHV